MTWLYIIRHFPTSWNNQWLCQWWKSWRIYKDGMRLPKDIFSLNKVDILISSDIHRAKKTAIFTKQFIWYKNRIKYMSEFRELNFWDFEGKEAKLIKKIQPEIYDEKDFFRYNVKLIWGESILDLKKRVEFWLKKLSGINKNILLITHGSVIHMIYSILLEMEYNRSYSEINIDFDKMHHFIL